MAIDTDLPQPGGPQTRPNEPAEGAQWPGQLPSGAPVAPAPSTQQPSDTGLPPGVHPNDPSGPESFTEAQEVGTQPTPTTRPPFATENANAFGVNQRAASDWDGGVVVANSSTNAGVATVVGRQKGRTAVKIWVPNALSDGTIPLGVVIGPSEAELSNPASRQIVLNVGDSVTIETEAAVYCAVIAGNAIGACQYLTLYNPAGGFGVGAN